MSADPQIFKSELICGIRPEQAEKNQRRRNSLRNGGGNGNARHSQSTDNDKKQIQDHIDHTGCGQEIQRPSGVPTARRIAEPKLYTIITGMAAK